MMKGIEVAELRFNHRKSELQELKTDVERLRENMNQSLDLGYYNEAGQWAEQIGRLSAKIEAVGRELAEFEIILRDLRV